MEKTIFITGASRGLGKETARLFTSKGWNVVATMRNPEKETELTSIENVSIYPLDVTNPQQIIQTVRQVIQSHDVDVVLNNAGYGLSGPLEALSDEQIVRELNTNLLGTIRVTKEFIPFLKKKGNSRIINITSLAGLVEFPLDSIYNASKWAVEGFTESLHYELCEYGVKVKTVAPGVILTDFGPVSLDSVHVADYDQMHKKYIDYMLGDMSKVSDAGTVAEVIYEAATDDKDQIRYIAGIDGKEMYTQRVSLGNEGFRQMLTKEVFKEK